ncbi:MAG TPA: cupin domain-containing protein [Candidatus Angelobacter sp.]|nr:cupin domain-containing protein [Candidatus Angelobacter sp.]
MNRILNSLNHLNKKLGGLLLLILSAHILLALWALPFLVRYGQFYFRLNADAFKAFVKPDNARLSTPAALAMIGAFQAGGAAKTTESSAPSKVTFFSGADVRASFEKGTPLMNKDGHSYWVITGHRDKPGQSELHEKDTDVFYVTQGSATFVTGGKMLEPKATGPGEIRGSGIEGGETRTISKDDVIVIPAGVPHWFKDVQGTFLYLVVKVE